MDDTALLLLALDHVRPLWVLWTAWLAMAILVAPRDRAAWGLGAVALVAGLWVADPGSPLPYDKGFGLAEEAVGKDTAPPWWVDTYGDAWASAGSLVFHLTGSPSSGAWTALGASVLAVVFAVGLARRTDLPSWATSITGLSLALLPLPLAMSQTVTRFSLAPMLLAAGTASAVALSEDDPERSRVHATMVWMSAALLAHTRPFLMVVALGLLAVLAWRRRWRALAPGLLLVLMRIPSHLRAMPDAGTARGAKLDRALIWWTSPWEWWDGPVAFDPWMTPWIVALLAVVGAVAAGAWRGRPIVLALWALATLPFLHFAFDFDLARMQLGSMPLLVVIAGHGLVAVWSRGVRSRWRPVVIGGLVLATVQAWWMARHPRGEPVWSWVVEDRLLREGLADCPADRPIVYDPTRARDRGASWFARRGHRRVVGLDVEVPPGSCRFVGLTAWETGTPELSGWAPVRVETIVLSSDGWYDNEGQTVTIGWYVREPRREGL